MSRRRSQGSPVLPASSLFPPPPAPSATSDPLLDPIDWRLLPLFSNPPPLPPLLLLSPRLTSPPFRPPIPVPSCPFHLQLRPIPRPHFPAQRRLHGRCTKAALLPRTQSWPMELLDPLQGHRKAAPGDSPPPCLPLRATFPLVTPLHPLPPVLPFPLL